MYQLIDKLLVPNKLNIIVIEKKSPDRKYFASTLNRNKLLFLLSFMYLWFHSKENESWYNDYTLGFRRSLFMKKKM